MSFHLDENFDKEYRILVANVRRKAYYINMMRAWYFATALAKQYEQKIQKAVESLRITKEQKDYLKILKKVKHHKKGEHKNERKLL